MRKILIIFAVATFALPLAISSPASAVINNGGDGAGIKCDDLDGNGQCQLWCGIHNQYEQSQKECRARCWRHYCKSPVPKVVNKPTKKGRVNTAPIINGRPLGAPT